MKLINPKVEMWFGGYCAFALPEIWKHIARCARTCYQSEPRSNGETDEEFVKRVILRNHSYEEIAKSRELQLKLHLSVLEHGTVYLFLANKNYDISLIYRDDPYSMVYLDEFNNSYVTTNMRVIVENGRMCDLEYLCPPDAHFYLRTTFNIITDIGVARELARHRSHSISEESTRFCVSGNTYLSFKNEHNKYTIKELYDNKKHLSQILIKYLNEDTGMFEYAKPKNVFYNGKKQTYKVKTKLGYELTCTKEHLIYTPIGYKSLETLKVGDPIYVNGVNTQHLYQNKDWLYNQYITLKKSVADISRQFKYKEDVLRKWLYKLRIVKPISKDIKLYKDKDWLYRQNITLNKTFVDIANEFGYNLSTIKNWARKFKLPQKGTGYFNKGRVPWNKGLDECNDKVKIQANALREYHYDNSKKGIKIMKENTIKYQKHNSGICSICGTNKNLNVHHIDKDRGNNNPCNLITLCESCHLRVHKHSLLSLYADNIVSIEKAEIEDVYDIEMPIYHNYIANGIVAHNCNYSKKKFGNELTFIIPNWVETRCPNEEHNGPSMYWSSACKEAESNYLRLLENGWTPQQVRQVLPLSTKVQTIHTAFNDDWEEFIKLRADACSGSVHPNMKVVANMIKNELYGIKAGC